MKRFIQFILSEEFLITTIIMVCLSFLLGEGDVLAGFNNLANVKQNLDWYVWAYVIYRLHQHHKLLERKGGEKDG